MERRLKKTPADYGQINFRVSKEDVDALNQYVVKVQKLKNHSLAKEEKKFSKGETMATALEIGLSIMERAAKKGSARGKT